MAMRFESAAVGTFAIALSISATMALVRAEEEFGRRTGLKGTRLHADVQGRNIEFDLLRGASSEQRPVLVLENGLGSPLESWDWVEYLLRDRFDVLRYHRRGYARTKSLLRPARILEELLTTYAPAGPVIFAAHSMGALVTANAISESRYLQQRTKAVFIVDGTDAELLAKDRASRQRSGRFRQTILQEALASVTGVNRWVTSSTERDVEYRPDIQRSFLVIGSSLRTQCAALREYATEPLGNQRDLTAIGISQHVLSAADNIDQQSALARRLGASFAVIPSSSHRSIIGRLPCAEAVADALSRVEDVH